LVECPQVRQGHVHIAHGLRLLPSSQRRRHDCRRAAPQTQHDRLDVKPGCGAALVDDILHDVDRMQIEQLQHAHVLLDPAASSVLLFQGDTQFVKQRRQVPAAKDIRVVERCRAALQCFQVMTRVEHLLVPAVTARLRRDDFAAAHHLDAVDVDLDRDVLERGRARHAVAIGVDTDRLIFVHPGRLHQAGIEGTFGEGQRIVILPGEALADAFRLPLLDAFAIPYTAALQMGVQFRQVVHARHRRGPVTLQVTHPPLDPRLLLRSPRQTKQRQEGVMTDQRLITFVEPAFPGDE
jgi:hypothetical protein